MAIIPTIVCAIVFGLSILESLAMVAYAYWSIIGAVLFTTGITANNPAYDDQKSAAFQINTFVLNEGSNASPMNKYIIWVWCVLKTKRSIAQSYILFFYSKNSFKTI